MKDSKILRAKRSQLGIAIIVAILLLVLTGPLFIKYSPYAVSGIPNSHPNLAHLFGTDYLGHDVLSEVVYGAYPSLIVALVAAAGASIFGFFLGCVGGYYRRTEAIVSGATDIIISIPTLVLLITIGAMFSATNALMEALIILVMWPLVARAVRPQVTTLKKGLVVDVAKMNGLSNWRILWEIIAPDVIPIAIAYFVIIIAYSIIIVSALEFLGVGNLSIVSWGQILYYAQNYAFYDGDWWWILAPGILISLVASSFALIGFTIENIMNPRLATA